MKNVIEAVPEAPLIIGSGVNPSNIVTLLKYAEGAIVGTYLKKDGVIWNLVDIERVRTLIKIVEKLR